MLIFIIKLSTSQGVCQYSYYSIYNLCRKGVWLNSMGESQLKSVYSLENI